jgi:hypothetical protein
MRFAIRIHCVNGSGAGNLECGMGLRVVISSSRIGTGAPMRLESVLPKLDCYLYSQLIKLSQSELTCQVNIATTRTAPGFPALRHLMKWRLSFDVNLE